MLPAPAKQNEETSDSSEKQEEQPLTYDDKLAENYRDLSGQNAVFIQLTIALALKGSHDHREVLHAYKTLKNPLDPKKLVEDPAYRQEVERCLALVEKCEKKALKKGKCKLKEEIERTRFSLTQVKTTYQNLHIFSLYDSSYVRISVSETSFDYTNSKTTLFLTRYSGSRWLFGMGWLRFF